MGHFQRISGCAIYEISCDCHLTSSARRRYNRHQRSRLRATGGAVMADLLDFVSLSLLPPWCWRVGADWLRRGDAPRAVVRRLLAASQRGDRQAGDDPVDARALAADAIQRARTASIAAVPWRHAPY